MEMDLIIFIVGFLIFVIYLVTIYDFIYLQNKIQDQELENDLQIPKKNSN